MDYRLEKKLAKLVSSVNKAKQCCCRCLFEKVAKKLVSELLKVFIDSK